MMTKYRIYPYKQGSASAKKLAETLDGKVLKHVGSKYRPRLGDVVVNWGAAAPPVFAPATTLNADVRVAQCKLATFDKLQAAGVCTPPHWTAKGGGDQVFPVVCRTKLRGHSGDGIVIANNPDELVGAPLYTKYIKKKDEYRVHVIRDKAFFIQRKARKLDNEQPNWMIRNLAGGFVFVECPAEEVPADVINQAVAAIAALAIDFGGVDVIWNDKEQRAFVLEVNTACGVEDRTAQKYSEAFHNLFDRR
jgi:glutathione synthase/RimK-type ligase-like ATP-grasp enzyme